MKFGVGLPTGMEGLMYPVPFGDAGTIVRISQVAERLGYDSVGGNDHLTTQHYVAKEFATPPNYYDIFVALAFAAAATTRLRLQTAVAVLPYRQPVVLAKQAATLDRMSGGRLILGVGIGAYREEFEALYPGQRLHRGEMLDEGIQALLRLFNERRASFQGRYYSFKEVEMYPKPLQQPLPIYVGGNSAEGMRRAALYAHGWIPAVLRPAEISERVKQIREMAVEAGRNPDEIEIAPQISVCIDSTFEAAVGRFQRSQAYQHLLSLKRSTLRGQSLDTVYERNLIGSPDQILERVAEYQAAGCGTLSALVFTGNSESEVLEQVQRFAEVVFPVFAGGEERA